MAQVDTSAVAAPTTLSAKGTRLNRRGLATRGRILDIAVDLLSGGGPDAVSANLIAREAGVTWGTIQHQFGEADGVWAAVIEHVSTSPDFYPKTEHLSSVLPLTRRLEAVVDLVWTALDSPSVRAVHNLRLYLPRDLAVLEEEFPRTAAALAAWDARWAQAWDRIFDGLSVSRERLAKARSLVPAAIRGLHDISDLSTYTDISLARTGLIEAMALYLS
ncbi:MULTISPECIES: TetR/AcrR family transcriptional regulator [unclassified Pseudofrankia]|uniref:TetR/AcrR family transcriptional regulator n=1 Tax=unclassified Pseudofrankia TaxID=2994372 RepID=UPI0008D9C635|nr:MULTISPECIES: TetR/AcrR family transcriptional regulator [unclassified Pseudofrankia]MDT3438934.1 helix-turn-helix domain-containing protein [Pseudofrankia sp. BMG5.37]OHV56940.1 TetR family transcriptional regulator [Pseudofrankia sp. BMG5.36]